MHQMHSLKKNYKSLAIVYYILLVTGKLKLNSINLLLLYFPLLLVLFMSHSYPFFGDTTNFI